MRTAFANLKSRPSRKMPLDGTRPLGNSCLQDPKKGARDWAEHEITTHPINCKTSHTQVCPFCDNQFEYAQQIPSLIIFSHRRFSNLKTAEPKETTHWTLKGSAHTESTQYSIKSCCKRRHSFYAMLSGQQVDTTLCRFGTAWLFCNTRMDNEGTKVAARTVRQ